MLILIEVLRHKGWLNSIELCTFRELKFGGGQLNFRKAVSGGDSQLSLLIKNASINDFVWNVTDALNVRNHDLQFVDSESVSIVYRSLDFQMKSLLFLMEQNIKNQIY